MHGLTLQLFRGGIRPSLVQDNSYFIYFTHDGYLAPHRFLTFKSFEKFKLLTGHSVYRTSFRFVAFFYKLAAKVLVANDGEIFGFSCVFAIYSRNSRRARRKKFSAYMTVKMMGVK
mmetsp:Transcript_11727/g.13491  ORF Transcript_11727/g.13491 Transcript_11727/m.13491 type:complete len:116 (-) Transcript_11727:1140-1487(-)